MPLFRTFYSTPKGELPTQCYAKDADDLIEIMKLRGLGERRSDPESFSLYNIFAAPLRKPVLASEHLRRGELAEANHALIWACMIASKAGIVDGFDLFNDYGLVHELAHAMHSKAIHGYDSQRGYERERLIERMEAFEMLVPGLHPCWAGDDQTPVYRPQKEFDNLFEGFMMRDMKSLPSALDKIQAESRLLRPKRSPSPMIYMLGDSNHDSYLRRDIFDTIMVDEKRAPTAKPGSKKFDQQRIAQMAAVKSNKSDLVAKLKEQHHKRATGALVTKTLAEKGNVTVGGEVVGKAVDITIKMDNTLALKDIDKLRRMMAPVTTTVHKSQGGRPVTGRRARTVVVDDPVGDAVKSAVTKPMELLPYQRAAMEMMMSGLTRGRMSMPGENLSSRPKVEVEKGKPEDGYDYYPGPVVTGVIHDEIQITTGASS